MDLTQCCHSCLLRFLWAHELQLWKWFRVPGLLSTCLSVCLCLSLSLSHTHFKYINVFKIIWTSIKSSLGSIVFRVLLNHSQPPHHTSCAGGKTIHYALLFRNSLEFHQKHKTLHFQKMSQHPMLIVWVFREPVSSPFYVGLIKIKARLLYMFLVYQKWDTLTLDVCSDMVSHCWRRKERILSLCGLWYITL